MALCISSQASPTPMYSCVSPILCVWISSDIIMYSESKPRKSVQSHITQFIVSDPITISTVITSHTEYLGLSLTRISDILSLSLSLSLFTLSLSLSLSLLCVYLSFWLFLPVVPVYPCFLPFLFLSLYYTSPSLSLG